MKPFAETCERIGSVSSKLEKVQILADYFKNLNYDELLFSPLFFTGNAFAARDTRKLNLGGQMIKKALAEATEITSQEDLEKLNTLAIKISEPGDLVYEIVGAFGKTPRANHHSPLHQDMSLQDAEDFFDSIDKTSGSIAKVNLLANLYKTSDVLVAKYVTKILAGDLRIGLKEASVEDAIIKAFDEKSALVKSANMFIGHIGEVAQKAYKHNLEDITLTPFWPVKVMLATPAEDADEIIKRMGENIWAEDKYDGVRCQAHKFGDIVKLFSRDQNEITNQFPEIVKYVSQLPHDIILDGEIMAFKNNEIMRFFFLQQRLGRKKLEEDFLKQIPVEYFVYDILYLDGKELLTTNIRDRREIIEKTLGNTNTKYNNANYSGIHLSHKAEVIGKDALEIAFDDAKARITEGLMIKKPDSAYKPGRRGIEWLKYKKALEPLDVVITGVEYGHGKKAGFLSDYTFAVRDKKSGELVNIGKAFSGVTDEDVKSLTERFLKTTLKDEGRFRTVKPEVVLEVQFESIQKSARYLSGYALRFPRITKIRIGDKGVDDINTLQDVAKMYEKYFAYSDVSEDAVAELTS